MQDRRVRRTLRSLREALISLTLERGYAAITVEDIAERADISRATFYKHYADKTALLEGIVGELSAELDSRLAPLAPVDKVGFTGEPIREIFRHASEERDLYRVILRGEGDGRALRQFVEDRSTQVAKVFGARAKEHDTKPRVDLGILARAWVGQQVAVLQWWIEQDEPEQSIDTITAMLTDISIRGRWWASGNDGAPPES